MSPLNENSPMHEQQYPATVNHSNSNSKTPPPKVIVSESKLSRMERRRLKKKIISDFDSKNIIGFNYSIRKLWGITKKDDRDAVWEWLENRKEELIAEWGSEEE